MKYVALLRGISPMNAPAAKLRAVFESLGFDGVQSIISSGNVVFISSEIDMARLEGQISQALSNKLELDGTTIIRTSDQIQRLVDSAPFGSREHSRESYLTVTFLKNQLESGKQEIFSVNDTTDTRTPDLMIKLEKEYGKAITTRTWNTVLKINHKF